MDRQLSAHSSEILFAGNRGTLQKGGAESGAFFTKTAKIADSQQLIIEAWPELPEVVKAGILAMVKATLQGKAMHDS